MKYKLHLTLKKKWFDMILSGEKRQEYREYKEYWKKRFIIPSTYPPICTLKYDTVVFKNGYSKKARKIELELAAIRVGFGNPEWGGDDKKLQFVLTLGRIV